MRDGVAYFGSTTLYKYAKRFNLSDLHKPSKKKKCKMGVRTTGVKQILYMDISELLLSDKILLNKNLKDFSLRSK